MVEGAGHLFIELDECSPMAGRKVIWEFNEGKDDLCTREKCVRCLNSCSELFQTCLLKFLSPVGQTKEKNDEIHLDLWS